MARTTRAQNALPSRECTCLNYMQGGKRSSEPEARVRCGNQQIRIKQVLTKLFLAARINSMQSKKASKKTAQNAEETVSPANLESAAGTETSAKPRTVRSSKPKSESGESATKRHRAATPVVSVQSAPAVEVAPKAMAAGAGQGAGSAVSAVIDPVGVEAASSTPVAAGMNEGANGSASQISNDEIANLAHSYWLARGGEHGAHDDDWFRAEQELKSRR